MKKLIALALLSSGCAAPRREPVIPPPEAAYRGPSVRVPETPPPGPAKEMTLEQALALAEKLHPELAVARARIEAAEGRAVQAGLYPNPELVARMEVAPIHGGTADQAEYVVGLSQRVPVGGRLGAAVRVEELERGRLLKELEAMRIGIRSRVHGAFAAALYMEEAARLQAAALRIAEGGVAVTRARHAAGDALPEDVARVEMEELRVRLERDRALSLREATFVALAATLGDPGLRIGSVAGAIEGALEIPALESLLAALGQNPLVEAAEAGVAVERAREELARAQRIPDVNLDLFYRRQEASRTDAFDAGISVAIPLFDRNQGRIREARAETAAAEARVRATRNDLERQVRESHLRLARAMSHARLLKDEVLPRADTVLRGTETRYGGGDLGLAEVLAVRREHGAARLSYLESLREVMEAWAVLRAFLGN